MTRNAANIRTQSHRIRRHVRLHAAQRAQQDLLHDILREIVIAQRTHGHDAQTVAQQRQLCLGDLAEGGPCHTFRLWCHECERNPSKVREDFANIPLASPPVNEIVATELCMRTATYCLLALLALPACEGGSPTDDEGTLKGSVYEGVFSGTIVDRHVTPGIVCENTWALSGTVQLTLRIPEGAAGGQVSIQGEEREVGVSGDARCLFGGTSRAINWALNITGTPEALVGDSTMGGEVKNRWRFTGALNGNTVNGTLRFSITRGTNPPSMSDEMPVTLTQTRSGR